MEIKAKLNKPYTAKQRADFIVVNNHNKSYEIKETADSLEAWGLTNEEESEKGLENKKALVRAVRNSYLQATDKYMLVDFPISDEERDLYLKYRVYLRDYTRVEGWFEKNPLTFDEFCNSAKEVDEEELSVVNESESEVI